MVEGIARRVFTPRLLSASLLLVAVSLPALAAPPAGQRCPAGASVIGFDAQSNIICSEVCGNGVTEGVESCDDGNLMNGDGCSSHCAMEGASANPASASAPAAAAVVASPAPPASPAAYGAPLSITGIDPYSVVYGKRELRLTVTGTGFSEATRVIFRGKQYTPTVNAAGTELQVTLATKGLLIGRYALTISNGVDQEITRKGAIAVF